MVSSIAITEYLKIMDRVITIDTRSMESYNNNHIPGSRNVPLERLLLEPHKYLDKATVYYLYCQKGISTLNVCRILNNMGYQTIHIDGGYESWIIER